MSEWEEYKGKIEQEMEEKDGYAIIMFTDRFEVDKYPLSEERKKDLEQNFGQKLVDMRVFNEECECRIFRGDAGKKFHWRVRKDVKKNQSDGRSSEQYFDDEQYLDIDEIKSKRSFKEEGKVYATGGGAYRIPVKSYDEVKNAKLIIRNYLEYEEETGQAYIKDWRLVKIFREEE